jgi:CO dehydrogenase maturation factor
VEFARPKPEKRSDQEGVTLTISIAVAGKGGTGKTTLSALMVRALCETGIRPVLAVDADPNSNLAESLGVAEGRPLAEIREHGSSPEGAPPGGVGRVRAIEDEIQRAITEADGFDLITMGRPEGPRCYCYVNTLLRKSLDGLARSYAAVLMDNEAGMEHLSRRTTNNVDVLIAVANPALPAIRAARRVATLCGQLPINIGHQTLLLNRMGPDRPTDQIERELAEVNLVRLGDIPQDDAVEQAGATGESVFSLPEQSPALCAVRALVEQLGAMAAATSDGSRGI